MILHVLSFLIATTKIGTQTKFNSKTVALSPKLSILLLALHFCAVHAQVKNNGVLYIGDTGLFHIKSGIFNFGAGTITTTRTNTNHGLFSFSNQALWEEANTLNHVDGYVQSSFDFLFPTGHAAVYAPVQVTSSATQTITAAYTRANPNELNGEVKQTVPPISEIEFWNIKGMDRGNVASLTWRSSSKISKLTNANLTNLTIVGWNGEKWVELPSLVDPHSILGDSSSLESGSISSLPDVNLTPYSVFTFGKKETTAVITAPHQFAIYVSKNTLFIDSSEPVSSLTVYTLLGQKIFEKKIAATEHYSIPFFQSQAVYVAIVGFENDSTPQISTKIMNKL